MSEKDFLDAVDKVGQRFSAGSLCSCWLNALMNGCCVTDLYACHHTLAK